MQLWANLSAQHAHLVFFALKVHPHQSDARQALTVKADRINVQSVRLDTPASKRLKLRPSAQQAPTQKKVHQCVALAQQVIIVLKERKRPPYVMVEHLQ